MIKAKLKVVGNTSSSLHHSHRLGKDNLVGKDKWEAKHVLEKFKIHLHNKHIPQHLKQIEALGVQIVRRRGSQNQVIQCRNPHYRCQCSRSSRQWAAQESVR